MGKRKTPTGNYSVAYGKANRKNEKVVQPKPLYYLQINFANDRTVIGNPLFFVSVEKEVFKKPRIFTTCYGMGVTPTFFTSKRKASNTVRHLLKINPRITSVQVLFLDVYSIVSKLFMHPGYLKTICQIDESKQI